LKRFQSSITPLAILSCLVALLLAAHFAFSNHRETLRQSVVRLEEDIANIQNRLTYLNRETAGAEFPAELLWSESNRADAELSLQKTAVDLVSKSGMTLVSFNNSGVSRELHNQTVSFNIELEGSLEGAFTFLAEVENHLPRVAIGTLRLRPSLRNNQSSSSVSVFLQLNLWVFWGQEA